MIIHKYASSNQLNLHFPSSNQPLIPSPFFCLTGPSCDGCEHSMPGNLSAENPVWRKNGGWKWGNCSWFSKWRRDLNVKTRLTQRQKGNWIFLMHLNWSFGFMTIWILAYLNSVAEVSEENYKNIIHFHLSVWLVFTLQNREESWEDVYVLYREQGYLLFV